MPRYLISFDDGAMDHIPAEELPAVGEETHAVVRAAKEAGVWIFGAGMAHQKGSVVGTDGAVGDLPFPEAKPVLGGFALVEVGSHEEALEWAARIAATCRCAQEVREVMYDPES